MTLRVRPMPTRSSVISNSESGRIISSDTQFFPQRRQGIGNLAGETHILIGEGIGLAEQNTSQ